MLSFAFSGLFTTADTDAAALDVETTLASFVDSIEVNKANTGTCTVMGQAVELENIQIDLGNKVTFRDRPNAAYIALTDREVTGTLSFAATTIAATAWVQTAKTGTTGALAIQHGSTEGNIVKLDAPVLQLEQPSYSDGDGGRLMTSSIGLKRTAGDDEFKLTVQ